MTIFRVTGPLPKPELRLDVADHGDAGRDGAQLSRIEDDVSPLRALARRAGLRRFFELGGDWLRFQVDHVTAPRYQPLPWRETRQRAIRAESVSRWEAMLPVIRELEPRSAVDIGCSIGWFTVKLASLGIVTQGIEPFPPYYRTAIFALKRMREERAAVSVMELNEQTASLLPRIDCSLFLALWHHLVRRYGESAATTILSEVWARTDKVLFFESGETEMGPEFGLPRLEPDARTWFTDYLGRVCHGGAVRHLGLHHAGTTEGRIVRRNLFAVVREETA